MHELSVTTGILNICLDEQKKHSFKRVKEIRIKVGELTGLIPDCIDFYFNEISKGTSCQGALLKIEKVPIEIECSNCGYKGVIKDRVSSCPKCTSYEIRITNGREFYIDSLEVE